MATAVKAATALHPVSPTSALTTHYNTHSIHQLSIKLVRDAGAISVALHYVMPNSYKSGLVHGALSESGLPGAQDLQVALNRTARVAQLVGSPKSCLKKADLGALVRTQKTVQHTLLHIVQCSQHILQHLQHTIYSPAIYPVLL